jgi:thiol-disulfide isomerase/thioredoxin
MKKSLIFLISLLLIAGCQSKNTFTIKGNVKESKNKTIQLKRVNVNTLMLIDSSKVSSNGKFKFKIKATYPDFYQLGFSNTDFITILTEPGEKIKLVFNGTDLSQNYTVSGSEGSEKVRMLDMRLARTKLRLDSLRTLYEAASKEPDFETKGPLLENEYMNVLKDIRKKNIEFIINNIKSMASIKAIYQRIDENAYVLYDPRDLQYLKIVSDSLGRYYPNSVNVQALSEDVKRELGQLYSRQVQDLASSSPEIHLDPNLKDINGKKTALSSLKGKIVLLAFWSVESKDCIAENLQLKDFYKTYHKKGFEIYQINVDTSEVKWRAEVKFDELPWINAREDDPLNPKNARLYNVKALPANYLYDRDGNIIGSNLHGKSLQIRLNQLFNNY